MISLVRRRDEINAGTDLCERCGLNTRYHLRLQCWEASVSHWSVQWAKRYYRECTTCGTRTPVSAEEALTEPEETDDVMLPSDLEEALRLRDRVEYAYAMAASDRFGMVQRAHPSVWGIVQEHIGPVAADWLRYLSAPPLDPKAAVRTLEQEFMALATMGYLTYHVERGTSPAGRAIDPTRTFRRAERLQGGLSPPVSRVAWEFASSTMERLESQGAPLPVKDANEISRLLVRIMHVGYAAAVEEAVGREA